MITRIRAWLSFGDDSGASAAEYALLIAGIAIVTIAAIFFLGRAVTGPFEDAGTSVTTSN